MLQQRWHQARRGHDRVDQNRVMACLQPFVNIGHASTAKDDGRGGGGGLNVRDMAGDHGIEVLKDSDRPDARQPLDRRFF